MDKNIVIIASGIGVVSYAMYKGYSIEKSGTDFSVRSSKDITLNYTLSIIDKLIAGVGNVVKIYADRI